VWIVPDKAYRYITAFFDVDSLLMQAKFERNGVDEDNVTVRTLTDVLEAKGYQVVNRWERTG
jgi:hypothetical protein